MILVFLAALAIIILLQHFLESSNFPTGYPRYPLIGSILSFWGTKGNGIVIKSAKDAHKYNNGKFMGIFIGPYGRGVLLYDYHIAREVAFSDKFAGRIANDYLSYHRGYGGRRVGVLVTEGQTWKTNRRFALSTLRRKFNQ